MRGRPGRREELAALGRHEAAVLEEYRRTEGVEDETLVQMPAAGGGIVCARIEAYSGDYTRFSCRRIDGAGNSVGTAFEVYAFSYDPDLSGSQEIGQQDLRECHPYFQVGAVLRISQQAIWTGSSWTTGWWAIDAFEVVGCP